MMAPLSLRSPLLASLRPPLAAALGALALLGPGRARADEPAIPLPTPVPPPKPIEPTPVPPPTRSDPEPVARTRFITDPVTDFGIIGLSLGFGVVLDQLIGTGELLPQQPNTSAKLLSIDRGSLTRTPSKGWNTVSNVGLYTAGTFAVVAPLITAYRFGGEAGWVDAILFAETVSLTTSVTNLAKIAVRRPRPLAYQRQAALEEQYGAGDPRATVTGTDTALSFFSGHASTVASIGATATYLSFARSPGTPWPWITMGASVAATTLTSYGRVAAGKHFPTDVLAGAMAGAAIGLMVPHLHREQTMKQRPVWLGGSFSDKSGEVSLQGLF